MHTPTAATAARGDLLVLLAAMIWGLAFYFQKTAMLHIGPLLFLGLRSAVAVVVLLPLAGYEQAKTGYRWRSVLPLGLLAGAIFLIAGTMQQWGMVSATVINTGVLTALYIVVTPLAFWLVKQQRPAANVWLAVGLAFAGVWLLGGGSLGGFSFGDTLVAASTIFWGLGIVVAGEAARHTQPLTFTCLQFLLVTLLALPLAFGFESVSLDAVIAAIDSILYVGVLSSALTFAVMAVALQHIPATRASILLATEMLFSVAAGYVLLGERLVLVGWLGVALVIAAVLVVRTKKSS